MKRKEELKEIDPKECRRWSLADRDLSEFGDLYKLGKDIMNNGQIEPIIVRPLPLDDEYKYEVIAGSRRWRACLENNIKVKALVSNMSDTDAVFAQIRENEKEEISDYSKGLSYSKMIENGTITIQELSSILNISKAKLHNFLIFAKVPQKIWDAISKKDKISSRTAACLYSLSKKGANYIEAIIEIAEEIKNGAGQKTIERLINNIVQTGNNKNLNVINNNGQVIATWKENKIVFDKNYIVDKEKINELLAEYFNSKEN